MGKKRRGKGKKERGRKRRGWREREKERVRGAHPEKKRGCSVGREYDAQRTTQ